MSNSTWSWIKNKFSNKQPTAGQPPCFWRVDVHSHLIPGIDDGVATHEQAIDIVRKMAGWGIDKVITTPHVSQRFRNNDIVRLQAGRDALQEQIDREHIPVRVEVAAEYMLDEFFLDKLDRGPLLSFGSESFLLVETSMMAQPMQFSDLLFRIQTAGYTPVLAHPERYPHYYDRIDELERLRDVGCLLQLNWMSLTGRYGSRARNQARQLLRNRWVDLIGSDIHRPADLPALEAFFSSSSYDLLREQPLRNRSL